MKALKQMKRRMASIAWMATTRIATLEALRFASADLGRRAQAATVGHARPAIQAALTDLDWRLRAALDKRGGCMRWGHAFKRGSRDWIGDRDRTSRCHFCRLWYWMSDDGWSLIGDGASRTCACGQTCPATHKCPACLKTAEEVAHV